MPVLDLLQEKVADVGRKLSIGHADSKFRFSKKSLTAKDNPSSLDPAFVPSRFEKKIIALGSTLNVRIAAAPTIHIQTTYGEKGAPRSGMGNKATSPSEEEAEVQTPGAQAKMHTFDSTLIACENGEETDLEMELPTIPKMQIFSHPLSAGDVQSASVTDDCLSSRPEEESLHQSRSMHGRETMTSSEETANLASELENIVKEKMEMHEGCDWRCTPDENFGAASSGYAEASGQDCNSPSELCSPYCLSDSSPNKEGDEEVNEQRDLRRREFAIRELIETERLYVRDLADIVEGYVVEMRNLDSEVKMPDDLKEGKDKIVFGNVEAIYDWHRNHFLRNIEDFLLHPENIGKVFQRSEIKFQMYVKYCQNKPKSEYIVSEYSDYFEELRQKLGHKLQIPDLLIKPVQRIMKYQLLLRDILKHTERARITSQVDSIRRALEIMTVVPKSADDMMNVGRLQGFPGKIMAQGKLLLYGPLLCSDGDSSSSVKLKEFVVFLFEQSIIFADCEGKKKQFTNQKYLYRNHLQTNKMVLSEKVDDKLQFLLKSTDRNPSRSDIAFLCQGADKKDRGEWVSLIRHLLQAQKDFLLAIQSPIAYQKEKTKNMIQATSNCTEEKKPSLKLLMSSQPLRKSSTGDNNLTDVRRQSDPTDNLKLPVVDKGDISPSKSRKPFFRLPIISRTRSDRRLSSELCLESGNRSPASVKSEEDCLSIEAGMMVKALNDFTALKEDEISIVRGEVIQVLSCNSVRGFLVHRPASSVSPAAEGWVPPYVLLPPAQKSPLTPSDSSASFFPTKSQNVQSSSKKPWRKLKKNATAPDLVKNFHPTQILAASISCNPNRSPGMQYLGRNYPYLGQFSERNLDPATAPIRFSEPLRNATIRYGEPVVLRCKAGGKNASSESLNATWFGPGGELTDPRFEVEQHRDGTFELHFTSARMEDTGDYMCIVSFDKFSVSTAAFLRVTS